MPTAFENCTRVALSQTLILSPWAQGLLRVRRCFVKEEPGSCPPPPERTQTEIIGNCVIDRAEAKTLSGAILSTAWRPADAAVRKVPRPAWVNADAGAG